MRIRRAARTDGPRLLELDRELARFEKLTPPDDEEGRRLLAWIFDEGRLEALVAEADGEVAGMALFYEGLGTFRAKPFLYLEDLVVSAPARSLGVGEA
ncbi:MAG TPA: GNAT family N-acetyltransferase, partial [Thermoanaerobaculia bacterium]|nr:GNAT family N-acetyltransferase [Thermoanaerobaculia bacterium]